MNDSELIGWAAFEIFKRTVSNEDESYQHVLYTFESSHPYAPHSTVVDKIDIPSAANIRITFDSRCRTGNDTLTFYRDEELTNELKSFS